MNLSCKIPYCLFQFHSSVIAPPKIKMVCCGHYSRSNMVWCKRKSWQFNRNGGHNHNCWSYNGTGWTAELVCPCMAIYFTFLWSLVWCSSRELGVKHICKKCRLGSTCGWAPFYSVERWFIGRIPNSLKVMLSFYLVFFLFSPSICVILIVHYSLFVAFIFVKHNELPLYELYYINKLAMYKYSSLCPRHDLSSLTYRSNHVTIHYS